MSRARRPGHRARFKAEELIAGNGLRKLLAADFSLKRLGNYDRQISRSPVSMTTLYGVDFRNTVHLLERGVSRLNLKKAGTLIDYFAANVKLQFDDIFVSTIPQGKINIAPIGPIGPILRK
jgi:hypothetical protein